MIQKNMDRVLEIKRTLPAPAARVFEAWTNPAVIAKWFAPGEMTVPEATIDPRPGGQYRIVMREPGGNSYVAVGAYREVVKNERLVFTWSWEGNETEQTVVTVSLSAKGEKTDLVLTHSGFAADEAKERHLEGWNGCLQNLDKLLGA